MEPREFLDWLAFDAIEPIGDHRLELLLAYQTAALVASETGRDEGVAKHMPVLKASLPVGEQVEEQSGEEIYNFFAGLPGVRRVTKDATHDDR